jgi:hypothetical protein
MAKKLREQFNQEILDCIHALQRAYEIFNPEKVCDPLGFKDKIYKLKMDFFEAGGTQTLFDKLADRDFDFRFRGFYKNRPVVQEEIEDHYGFEKKPEQTA